MAMLEEHAIHSRPGRFVITLLHYFDTMCTTKLFLRHVLVEKHNTFVRLLFIWSGT